jgi:hypothetical protein
MEQYHLRLSSITGLLIIGHKSTKIYTGTKEELAAIYNKVLTHNLLFGWWGIVAFVWNIMAITRNASAMRQLKEL